MSPQSSPSSSSSSSLLSVTPSEVIGKILLSDIPSSSPFSHLPSELMGKILEEVEDFDDILACAAVCVSWKSEIEALYPCLKFILPRVPLLSNSGKPIFPPFLSVSNIDKLHSRTREIGYGNLVYKNPEEESCILFNTQTHTVQEIMLPELKGRWFYSSSYGCLLTVSLSQTKSVWLLNPFTRARIELPPPPTLYLALPSYVRAPVDEIARTPSSHEQRKFRVIASTNPWNRNCLFLAIYCETDQLAFCRVGDKTWTRIRSFNGCVCVDAICYKGEFYVLDKSAAIFRVDIDLSVVVKLPIKKCSIIDYTSNYLVEVDGDLFLVARKRGYANLEINVVYYRSQNVYVFKLDWDKKEWMKVKGISNNVILLGRYNSRLVSTIDCNVIGLKPNCIYFIDDHGVYAKSELPDIGVYDVGTQHFEWLYQHSPIWKSDLNWLFI